jgi:hypothetical protein
MSVWLAASLARVATAATWAELQNESGTFLLDGLSDAVDGNMVDVHDGYESVSAVLSVARRHGSKIIEMMQDMLRAYIESTRRIRKIEINKEHVALEEYLNTRVVNTGMPCMHMFIACTDPDVARDMDSVFGVDAFEKAVFYSGMVIGLVMDLYCLVPKHAELTEYSNVVRIMKRTLPDGTGWQQVVDSCVSSIDEYEEKLKIELEKIARTHPGVARAMEQVHAGSMLWLSEMRGRRYLDIPDAISA